MRCQHPECTGVHDNNRYRELCARSLDGKRRRDDRYHFSPKGIRKRIAFEYGIPVAMLDDFFKLPMEQKMEHVLELRGRHS
jgi:hypothetical protein